MLLERSAQHGNANALYVYITSLGNLSTKGEKNKAGSTFKNDRKGQASNRLTNQSQATNDENVRSTDD